MPTKVIACTCKHEFQDKRYGIGQRVHNEMRADNKKGLYRCTVCGNVKN